MKEENNFIKKGQKNTQNQRWRHVYVEDGRFFFFIKLYMSLPIHRCTDLSNPLKIDRDTIFFKDISNSRGNGPPKGDEGSENLNPLIFRQFDPKSTR